MNTKQIKSLRKMSTIVGTTSVIVGLSSTTLTSCATTNQFLVDYTNNPEAAGFNKIVLDALDDYINLKINQILYDASNNPVCYGFPSMQIMVTKDAKIIFNKAYGESLRYSQGKQDDSMEGIGEELPNEEKQIATTDTLYDLASVTKMYAGMFSIQHLLYEGKIGSITDPISKYIPSFQKEETIDNVTFN
jgi:CubicO group peptidase (beta-lactamase class C family)